ncbi:hypothetical protein [Lacihabitans lacunae]|uniref:Right handed beta helix domain-containing protein n=1 Tax=Lacihabitans lacunae TaxID=1028214 RepID=A0ABV7YZ91_9BACT
MALGICVFLCSFNTNAQTTRRVNGDPNITGVNVYNTIQAAVDAANTDDVILIEPYGNSNYVYYSSVETSKRIHFRGNGFNLNNPQLSFKPLDTRTVQLGNITFKNGSEGSTVKHARTGTIYVNESNISIEDSYCHSIWIGNQFDESILVSEGTNLKVRRCLVGYNGVNETIREYRNNGSLTSTNLLVENSVLFGILFSGGGVNNVISNSIFKNCQIYGNITEVITSSFVNCIFQGIEYTTSSNISYCISFHSLPNSNNNISNATYDQIFSGTSYSTTDYQGDLDRVLKNGSIASGAGMNGVDIGVYGSVNPITFSGLPRYPQITTFYNSGVGDNTTNISATATFKAN